MMTKCHGCGVEKDPTITELYPYPEDGIIDDIPIIPFLVLDVEPAEPDIVRWRRATVCHQCFHRLSPDMWISSYGWRSIKPATPFSELPELSKTC